MFIFIALILTASVWMVWGLAPALVFTTLAVAWHSFSLYNGPRMAARNAVYAALTCRALDPGQLGAIDSGVTRICERMGIDPSRLSPAFPLGDATPDESGPSRLGHPANVYSLRALAMHERGIPPIGTEVPKWYTVRNPFWAAMAPKTLERYRSKVREQQGVDLVELDPGSYVSAQ